MICHSTCVTGFFLVIFASQASGFFGALRDFAKAGNILQPGTCSALSSFLSRHGPRTGLGLTKQCPSMLTLCLRVTFTPPMVNLKLFWVYFCFSHFCCLTLFYHFFFLEGKPASCEKEGEEEPLPFPSPCIKCFCEVNIHIITWHRSYINVHLKIDYVYLHRTTRESWYVFALSRCNIQYNALATISVRHTTVTFRKKEGWRKFPSYMYTKKIETLTPARLQDVAIRNLLIFFWRRYVEKCMFGCRGDIRWLSSMR